MSDRLSEIRARLDRATGGPWLHGVQEGFHWVDTCPDRTVITIADDVPTDADAELIANAPGDIRWLLGEVERLRVLLSERDQEIRVKDREHDLILRRELNLEVES